MAETGSVRRGLASRPILEDFAQEHGIPLADALSELGLAEDRNRARLTVAQEKQLLEKYPAAVVPPVPAATPESAPVPSAPVPDAVGTDLLEQLLASSQEANGLLNRIAGEIGGRLSSLEAEIRRLREQLAQSEARQGEGPSETTLQALLYERFTGFDPDNAENDEAVFFWLVTQFTAVLGEKPDTQREQLVEDAVTAAKASETEEHLTPALIRGAAAEALQNKASADAGAEPSDKSKRGLNRFLDRLK